MKQTACPCFQVKKAYIYGAPSLFTGYHIKGRRARFSIQIEKATEDERRQYEEERRQSEEERRQYEERIRQSVVNALREGLSTDIVARINQISEKEVIAIMKSQ